MENISANSLTSIPTALANAFLWGIFIAKKSFWEPASLEISLIRVLVSPINAASLAFSKLRFLPKSNSAFISFSIEDWKSNKLEDAPSIPSKLNPNLSAWYTALAIAPTLSPKLALKFPDILVALSIVLTISTIIPSWAPWNANWPIISLVISFKGLPIFTDSINNEAAASALNPKFFTNNADSATFAPISSPKSPNILTWKPNFWLMASIAFSISLRVISWYPNEVFIALYKPTSWITVSLKSLAACLLINKFLENAAVSFDASAIIATIPLIIDTTVVIIAIGANAFDIAGPNALNPADIPFLPTLCTTFVFLAFFNILAAADPVLPWVISSSFSAFSFAFVSPLPDFNCFPVILPILPCISLALALAITVSLEALAAASKGPESVLKPGISFVKSEKAVNHMVFLSMSAEDSAIFPNSLAKSDAPSLTDPICCACFINTFAWSSLTVRDLAINSLIWILRVLTIACCSLCFLIALLVALADLAASSCKSANWLVALVTLPISAPISTTEDPNLLSSLLVAVMSDLTSLIAFLIWMTFRKSSFPKPSNPAI